MTKQFSPETLTLNGEWWISGRKRKKVFGTCTCSPDRIHLVLQGHFDATPAVKDDIKNILDSLLAFQIPTVQGDTEKGPCTLLDLLTSNTNSRTSSYTASYLIKRCHIDSLDVSCQGLQFGSTLHDHFFDLPFHYEEGTVDEDAKGIVVRFGSHKEESYELEPGERLVLSFNKGYSRTSRHLSLRCEPYFKITLTEPKPLKHLLVRMWNTCHLLTLLTDEGVAPTFCGATLAGRSSAYAEVFGVWAKRFRYDLTERDDSPLLTFEQSKNNLAVALQRWMTMPGGVMGSTIQLFLEGRMGNFPSIEGRFIVLAQAIEAFSRGTTNPKYMDQAEYDEIAAKIIAAIPTKLEAPHRESLKNRIKHGNEHSLRKRVMSLLDNLSDESQQLVCKSLSSFTDGIVNTRHYLTHYADDLREKALVNGGDMMLWDCVRMTMLLRIHLLKHLGFDEAFVASRIRGHWGLSQLVTRAKNAPECRMAEDK